MSPATFRRSLLVCCDLRRYGAADDQLQRELQELLVRCLDRAGAAAGLDRSTWHRQAKGDEEWAVLPPESPEHVVVDTYVRGLNAELTSANRYRVPEARARMRLAIHHGAVVEGANGFPGQDSVLVSRLLNSKPAHVALEEFPDADLVVVLSEIVYSSLVLAGHTTLRPTDFRRVEVVEKTFHGHGWMWIPNGDVHALDLADGPVARQTPAVNQNAVASGGSTVIQAGRDASVPTFQRADMIQNFDGNDQRGSHFGPSFGKGGEADPTR
ncbi:hypothetical protein ABZ816_12595 [Actinosynnema sp. NPDC047251]|uniref:Uncharacterized protein n=1 Tax=Saccharothrix espanaensis (strain ATCC 51144 / DSM 44229 / JCM 9112 / NBRC 15066 / NRRL 15764) TaxID=1179773 RepID=K0K581_SACES|nr:hypothetical protein [Saccharothrix espanaensis]CCH35435.1 hypothetical protein BN6_82180 [Saccharothrix espanaensis DSM 44229]